MISRLARNTVLLAGSAAVSVASSADAQEYYRQGPIDSAAGFSSQDARNPGGLGWFSEVADDFVGAAGWSIDRVEFWGGYLADPATPGHTAGFTVRFYADANGAPGARLFERDVTAFNEIQYYVSPPLPPTRPNGSAGYHYSLELPSAFSIASAGRYWMSIVAILDQGGASNEPRWGWVAAAASSGPAAMQWFLSPGDFSTIGIDVSFVLGHGAPRCVADFDDGSGAGTPDGGVTIDDLLYYLTIYGAGVARADIDDGSGTGTADGGVTIEDLLYFLVRFNAGC